MCQLLAEAPFGHWKTTSFTAGLRRERPVAPFVLDGPMSGEVFLAYVEKILVPTLRPYEIVVMEDLPAHEVAGACKLTAEDGAEISLLPAHPPDLNPIEMVFSQLRSHLRNPAELTVPALWDRIGQCLDEIIPQACPNYFAKAGYAPS